VKPVWANAGNQSTIDKRKSTLMAKKSRGGRMTAAKNRAAATKGGRGPIKKRPAGRRIMST
jgi:hypothetical protein